MPQKKYRVDLTGDERAELEQLLKSGKHNSGKLPRARILLLADAGKTDTEIAAALAGGATDGRAHPAAIRRAGLGWLRGEIKAARARASGGKASGASDCRRLPGCSLRTRRLDAAAFGGQGGRTRLCRFDSARNHQRDAQKNKLKPWLRKQWCVGTVTAEYVAAMEDVLDLYAEDYNQQYRVVCFDEREQAIGGGAAPGIGCRFGQARTLRL